MRLTVVEGSSTDGTQRNPRVDSTKKNWATSASVNPAGKGECSFLYDCSKLSMKCPQYCLNNFPDNFMCWPEALKMESPFTPPQLPPSFPPWVSLRLEPSLPPRPPPSLPPRLLFPPRSSLSLLIRWFTLLLSPPSYFLFSPLVSKGVIAPRPPVVPSLRTNLEYRSANLG